jgi:hypothetical protein
MYSSNGSDDMVLFISIIFTTINKSIDSIHQINILFTSSLLVNRGHSLRKMTEKIAGSAMHGYACEKKRRES